MMRGHLIAFEGLDQSGKATQTRKLREHLEAAGHRVETLAFPDYATPIGAEIGRALHGERDFGPDVIQLLQIANRHEWKPRIESWLADGRLVVCDRYAASSVAYGEAQGLDPAWLIAVQVKLPQPSISVLLDIAPEIAARRKAQNRDRFEQDLAMLGRVRESYLRQAAAGGWIVVDAARPADEVAADVAAAVGNRIVTAAPPGPR
jgi:dTMP kinase